MTPLELFILGWLADKATGGIFSEYVKKFWFAKIHKQKDKAKELEAELVSLKRKYDDLEVGASQLIAQKDQVEAELIRLRIENHLLKKKNPPTSSSAKQNFLPSSNRPPPTPEA